MQLRNGRAPAVLLPLTHTRPASRVAPLQLELWNAAGGGPSGAAPTPMGSLTCRNFWMAYNATAGLNMVLQLSLPTMAIRDLRPSVPREASLVLSTADIGADLGADEEGGRLGCWRAAPCSGFGTSLLAPRSTQVLRACCCACMLPAYTVGSSS